jgi:hypothetical protein
MLAPMRGSPVSASVTVPLMVCAKATLHTATASSIRIHRDTLSTLSFIHYFNLVKEKQYYEVIFSAQKSTPLKEKFFVFLFGFSEVMGEADVSGLISKSINSLPETNLVWC